MMQSSLARKLRVLRAERGLTQRAASAQIGVTKETLSDLERGLRHPHDVTLSRIARGYGVPVEELLEENGPLAEAPQESGPPEAIGPAAPPLPRTLSLAALSPEELETRLFGAPAEEGEEPAPALTVEEAYRLVRAVRGERDALEDWVEAYASAPPENRLRARLDNTRAEESLARARLYYLVLLDYWSKLADPRGVPFKGVRQIVSERAEAHSFMQAIKDYQDERQRLEAKPGIEAKPGKAG